MATNDPQKSAKVVLVSLNPPTGIVTSIKRSAMQAIYDRGDPNPIFTYRASLAGKHPEIQTIAYAPFFQGWPIDKAAMAPDGIHLTDAKFHQMGNYIGRQIAAKLAD